MIQQNTLAQKIANAERELDLVRKQKQTLQEEKEFKFPFKWKRKLGATKRKANFGKILVIYLNKQGDIEVPVFLPIFDGNMVIYRNKPYEFDPAALWTIRGFKGSPKVLVIKETDRKPVRNDKGRVVYRGAEVNNKDLEEIRKRGDSTEHDEFLLKFLLRATSSSAQKKINVGLMILIGVVVIGAIIWMLSSS